MPMITVAQLRAARALAGITQEDLARRSRVSEPTIRRIEAGRGPLSGRPGTGEKLQRALEAAGVEFGEDGGVRPRRTRGKR